MPNCYTILLVVVSLFFSLSLAQGGLDPFTCYTCTNCKGESNMTRVTCTYAESPVIFVPSCISVRTDDGQVTRGCGMPGMTYKDGCYYYKNPEVEQRERVCRCKTADCNHPTKHNLSPRSGDDTISTVWIVVIVIVVVFLALACCGGVVLCVMCGGACVI